MLSETEEISLSEQLAKGLSYAGLLPFVSLSIAAIFFPGAVEAGAQLALLVYAAVILSFLGGIVWGRLLAAKEGSITNANRHLVYSNLPPLAAWFALFFDFERALLILASAFVAALLYDRSLLAAGTVPSWFYAMRVRLTVIAVASLLAPVIV